MNRPTTRQRPARPTRGGRATSPAVAKPRKLGPLVGTGVLAALALTGLFFAFRSGQHTNSSSVGSHRFQVGQPAAGQPAPSFSLAASTGQPVSLASYRGKSVLLFFQEGIGCQPCWDQIRDLEKSSSTLQKAGIDDIVSITTSPADLVAQKVRDDHLSTPVLSDPDVSVSRAYNANMYGMMGDSRDGHSFVLVGPDGMIKWRADYGGAPNYTMYLPVDRMLSDMRTAMSEAGSTQSSP